MSAWGGLYYGKAHPMKLRRLCKDASSGQHDECMAIYVSEDPAVMVAQVRQLDSDTEAELRDVASNEIGGFLPTETVLRATGTFLAERGRPSVLADVEDFLSTWSETGR